MPRNGSGTFTLVSGNPVVTGTTIESNWANTTLSDIATTLTDSLSRSGQGGMTAALRIADGTQGAPGIGFANETGSGFYRAGTGEVWAVVQGAQTLNLDANGVYVPADKTTTVDGAFVFNEAGADKDARFEGDTDANLLFTDASTDRVGVGTNTPSTKLHVVGDATVSGTVNATTLDLTNLEVTNIKAKDGTASASIADSTGVMSLVANPVLSGGTANGVLYLNGSKAATSGSSLTFDGSVLTLAPSQVTFGSSTLIALGSGTYFKAASTNGFLVNNSADTLNFFRIDTSGNAIFYPGGTEGMRLTSTGLGIGTSSPSQRLAVINNTTYQARAATATGNYTSGGMVFGGFGADASDPNFYGAVGYDHSTGKTYLRNKEFNAVGGIVFETATTGGFSERARITSGGDLLVGTTGALISGGSRLRVSTGSGPTIDAQSTNSGNAVVDAWNSATTGDNIFERFWTEGTATQRGSIDYNRAGGLVRYNTTSDYRAKDIIGPVQNPGATIDALKVYEGKMKGATQSRPMLIAHEAQEHAPYAVSGVKDEVNEDGTPKFQQMDVSSLVPLLLAEIQSLRARVAALEAQP